MGRRLTGILLASAIAAFALPATAQVADEGTDAGVVAPAAKPTHAARVERQSHKKAETAKRGEDAGRADPAVTRRADRHKAADGEERPTRRRADAARGTEATKASARTGEPTAAAAAARPAETVGTPPATVTTGAGDVATTATTGPVRAVAGPTAGPVRVAVAIVPPAPAAETPPPVEPPGDWRRPAYVPGEVGAAAGVDARAFWWRLSTLDDDKGASRAFFDEWRHRPAYAVWRTGADEAAVGSPELRARLARLDGSPSWAGSVARVVGASAAPTAMPPGVDAAVATSGSTGGWGRGGSATMVLGGVGAAALAAAGLAVANGRRRRA